MTINDFASEWPRTRPFKDCVDRVNQWTGKTFQMMAADAGFVRSTAWFNNNANYTRYATPPAPKYVPGVAKALGVSERRVAEMVAEQWYGVRPDDTVPDRLRDVLDVLRCMDMEDVAEVEKLAKHLKALRSRVTDLEFEVEELTSKASDEDQGEGEEPAAA
ncbi:hypothetical protein [Streptomyces sp. NBC_00207]|uniref:hypothetical protein n=1 Tax=unclassified Streptomyces TaxID=2593676 RepID=UPI0028839418|nr:hypothetical protein [Streptomyces sp. DSM 41633]